MPLLRKKAQTLQFRQPLGVQTAEEARTYVELTVAFVAGSIPATSDNNKNNNNINNIPFTSRAPFPDPSKCVSQEDLRGFLIRGARSSGIGDLRRGGVEKLLLRIYNNSSSGIGGGDGGGVGVGVAPEGSSLSSRGYEKQNKRKEDT
ncbi:hypothetical protein F5Y12DRAFT_232354 [Xylaria sp. FL1777]|nr:hypothetical protein F5Y12DRAFT_232354 [Xylaria sp. FL1777]